MPTRTSKDFRTHIIIDESHQEAMRTLRHELGSTSAVIRNALDYYLPKKMEEVSQRLHDRKTQTLMALQLQEQRASVDHLEDAYATRSEDFKPW